MSKINKGIRPFRTVKPNFPSRSVFDLSYNKMLTCDMGQLIPIMCDEVLPGDHWTIGNQVVVRFQPMVAPVLHEVNMYVHYFFVPYRLLWEDWEDFITSGEKGDDVSVIPKWYDTENAGAYQEGSLWDFLGFPVGAVPETGGNPNDATPIDFPRRAYYKIWNDYYRDANLEDEIDISQFVAGEGFEIMNRKWAKDMFTSAQISQQKGTAPALPISGTTSAVWTDEPYVYIHPGQQIPVAGTRLKTGSYPSNSSENVIASHPESGGYPALVEEAGLNDNVVDLSSATTFNVADLRLATQIQRWLERNQRAGTRYREFLLAHYGVTVPDERLQRCEYIGGSKTGVIFSETLQTSESNTTPQGNMAGHGILADQQFCGKCFAPEFGLIMGIMSIVPVPMYTQGINRQWQRNSRYDFPTPEFVNLSEQAIRNSELYVNPANGADPKNLQIFGYTGMYDELRYKPNMAVSKMRTDFDYWHLARFFSDYPELNPEFITIDPETLKRVFAVEDEPGLIVNFGNLIKAVRPIPVSAEPGLLDH